MSENENTKLVSKICASALSAMENGERSKELSLAKKSLERAMFWMAEHRRLNVPMVVVAAEAATDKERDALIAQYAGSGIDR